MLELDRLTRRFGATVALDGLSFTVPTGTIFGFVGPNGAGKTTAMRIVLGVLAADDGEARWHGRPIDAETRRRFGYMPEERGLYPKMRAHRQLVYLARLHGTPEDAARATADALLAELGLAERAEDRVEALSLGNQQRVQLAAALVHEPELLVLDEPFSGLDPVGVDVLAGVLRERAARRCDRRLLQPPAGARRAALLRRRDHQQRPAGRLRAGRRARGRRRAAALPAARGGRSGGLARGACRACSAPSSATASWRWSWRTAPTTRRCSTRRGPPAASWRSAAIRPRLADVFREVVAA